MTAPFDNIVQHLFHQPSLQSVTMGELERMVQQHPSFAAAQFLLLKKMQETSHPDFTGQLRKTTLYFNNPLWLQFLLQPQREKTEAPKQEDYHPSAINTVTETVHEQQTATATAINTEEAVHESETDTPVAEEYNYLMAVEEQKTAEQKKEEVTEPVAEAITAMSIAEEYNYTTAIVNEETVSEQTADKSNHEPINTIELAEEYNYKPVTETLLTDEQAHHEIVSATEDHVHEENEPTADEYKPASIETTLQTQQHTEETQAPETKKQETPLLLTIIETPAAKDDLLFEPYHTIDYFASQGIKLNKIEPEPQDKLGRQLKSFTEWLKSMKRLPQASVNKILAENEESQVVEAANHSVETKEVITETMAEVFEKQGLHEKATEVYHKLSLLNPSKSAYFAGKIEALKQ